MTELEYLRDDAGRVIEASGLNETFDTRALQSKTFSWGIWRINDCTLHEAVLGLYSDGLADYWARITTSDEDDVWLFKRHDLLSSGGDVLFTIPQFNGPNMVVSGFEYRLLRHRSSNPLHFPPQIFPFVTSVRLTSHC